MGKEILTFGNIDLEKIRFYSNKTSVLLKNINIEKVLVSNKISFRENNYKYFVGYLYNDDKVKPLNIMLPKTSTYVKSFDGHTNWIYILIEDDDF